jgi:hypothetical protein
VRKALKKTTLESSHCAITPEGGFLCSFSVRIRSTVSGFSEMSVELKQTTLRHNPQAAIFV